MRKTIGVFRGKRKDNGEWIEGFFTCATDCCGRSYFIDVPRKDPDDSNHRYEVVLETVGEYTGVDDIDGVRIFEGDIVKNIVTDLICAVARDNYYAGFVINKDSKTQFSLSKASGRVHQVIGNIHDSPELLGGFEMRPIDADVILKKFSAECEYSDDCKKPEPCITCIINGCPTLDVEPIKHGRWIEKKLSRMKWIPDERDGITAEETTIEDMTEQKCSVCQRWAIKFTHHIEMNYCPSCGARMDGENT